MYKECESIFHYVNLISISNSISFDGGKKLSQSNQDFLSQAGFSPFPGSLSLHVKYKEGLVNLAMIKICCHIFQAVSCLGI